VLSFPGRARSYPWREGAVNHQVLANLLCLLSQGNCFRHRRSHGQVEGCQNFNLEKQPLQQRLSCLVKKMSGKQTGIFQTNLELPNLFENRDGVMLSFEL
jgi:hypothetical protein